MFDELKVTLIARGDHSVGIQDHVVTVNTGLDPQTFFSLFEYDKAGNEVDDAREEARRHFKESLGLIMDENPGVQFSDECPECGSTDYEIVQLRTEGSQPWHKCKNPKCITAFEEERELQEYGG